MKVLYAGDGSSIGNASYLISVMKKSGIEYDHCTPNQTNKIPLDLDELSRYDVVILSDVPSHSIRQKRMETIKKCVESGMGLGMFGGWESFTGSDGLYNNTTIEEVLPVLCLHEDDRVNYSGGLKMIKKKDHPILHGLPWKDAPTVCGYNIVHPKKESETLLTLRKIESSGEDRIERIQLGKEENPLLIIGEYKNGRTLALTTDPAPHWSAGLVDWGDKRVRVGGRELGNHYIQLFYQMLMWLAKKSF